MTNLEKLEADIRGKLPRLRELTEGCFVSYKTNVLKVFCRRGNEIMFMRHNGMQFWVYDNSEYIDFIVGHSVMINDVLEWLGIEYMINGKGTICKWSEEEWRYIPQDNWNISEPLLKNQDQSVINYLAGLI